MRALGFGTNRVGRFSPALPCAAAGASFSLVRLRCRLCDRDAGSTVDRRNFNFFVGLFTLGSESLTPSIVFNAMAAGPFGFPRRNPFLLSFFDKRGLSFPELLATTSASFWDFRLS